MTKTILARSELLNEEQVAEINKFISGKILIDFNFVDDHSFECIIINFSDGTQLSVRYDWIYEWILTKND